MALCKSRFVIFTQNIAICPLTQAKHVYVYVVYTVYGETVQGQVAVCELLLSNCSDCKCQRFNCPRLNLYLVSFIS